MKHTLKQIFRSGKFIIGFVIFVGILLTVLIYPILVKDPPLGIISQGTFLAPGTYVNLYDSMNSAPPLHPSFRGCCKTAHRSQVK